MHKHRGSVGHSRTESKRPMYISQGFQDSSMESASSIQNSFTDLLSYCKRTYLKIDNHQFPICPESLGTTPSTIQLPPLLPKEGP
uniref:Putative ovule protein n=1 Tax=Solanum chacoense TaxID=4108 RepID=A0A0V0H277_SOLCH